MLFPYFLTSSHHGPLFRFLKILLIIFLSSGLLTSVCKLYTDSNLLWLVLICVDFSYQSLNSQSPNNMVQMSVAPAYELSNCRHKLLALSPHVTRGVTDAHHGQRRITSLLSEPACDCSLHILFISHTDCRVCSCVVSYIVRDLRDILQTRIIEKGNWPEKMKVQQRKRDSARSDIWIKHKWSYRRNSWPGKVVPATIWELHVQSPVPSEDELIYTKEGWCKKKDGYVLELVMQAKNSQIFHSSESTEAKMLAADPNFARSMTIHQVIAKMLALR